MGSDSDPPDGIYDVRSVTGGGIRGCIVHGGRIYAVFSILGRREVLMWKHDPLVHTLERVDIVAEAEAVLENLP